MTVPATASFFDTLGVPAALGRTFRAGDETRACSLVLAVGAQTRDLLWLVARQGGISVLAGLALGIGATVAFSRVLANLLYGIQPADSGTLACVSATLLAVAALAILLPARRAAWVDPMIAFREE
ncbi:MAG: hypothetical protein P4L56_17080 [Candidatus Sulfopaludibacter sp.]|nr:hypothetical protein [Candidatus Sulfopaludibacter sp.]